MFISNTGYLSQIWRVVRLIDWRSCSLKWHHCAVCDARRPMLKLADNEISLRCIICRSTSITLSLVQILKEVKPGGEGNTCYELSARGPLLNYLRTHYPQVSCSEFYEQISPGEIYNGVQCQDVQCLTYADQSFDLCTSTEVFEHVPDDQKGFSEIYRILKPGGTFVFTVPLGKAAQTVERVSRNSSGEIKHHLPPEYHLDPVRGHEPILVYRNYGQDIISRLLSAGFDRAEIRSTKATPWPFITPVIVAYRDKNL